MMKSEEKIAFLAKVLTTMIKAICEHHSCADCPFDNAVCCMNCAPNDMSVQLEEIADGK